MATHSGIRDDGSRFQIVPSTRKITVPQSHKIIGTIGSHNSEQLTFQCPKTIDGHDVVACSDHYIDWVNANGKDGRYPITDITTDDENMYFTWVVGSGVTAQAGTIKFAVHFEDKDAHGASLYVWGTTECGECQVLGTVRSTGGEPIPVPEGYLKPSGTHPITENGIYNVAEFAEVDVNVSTPEADSLSAFLRVRNGSYLFYKQTFTEAPSLDTSMLTKADYMFSGCEKLTKVPLYDTSNVTYMVRMFDNCKALTEAPSLDTSNATSMLYMFNGCEKLTKVPLYDTSNVTDISALFSGCRALTEVPLFDTSEATSMQSMFSNCQQITTVPLLDTSKATSMYSMFNQCVALTTVPALDMRNVTNFSDAFYLCKAVTDIRIRNIMANLQVGSGASYGHLLTVDSLTHLIYELRKQSSARTLTVGTANLAKLANVYVKAIAITDEMRAEDDLIDEKYPFVVCESTDEGAMLITTYASAVKNWTIK
jgi:surface protein